LTAEEDMFAFLMLVVVEMMVVVVRSLLVAW
jgi:hypothetical protein